MTDLIEAAYRFETAPADRADPTMATLLRLTCDIVDTLNDIYSLDKEATRGDLHNIVLILERQHAATRQDALNHAAGLLRAWSSEFIFRRRHLPDRGPLPRLATALTESIGGFYHWQTRSRRYLDLIPPHQQAYRTLLPSRPRSR